MKIEFSFLASVASCALYVIFAVTFGIFLITNVLCGSSDVAVTFITIGKLVVSSLTLVTLPFYDIRFTFAMSSQEVALHVVVDDTVWIALTLLASDDLVKTVGSYFTFVATFSGHVWWADASSSFLFTKSSAGTVAGTTVRESEETSLTEITSTADNVGLAVTLTTELFTLETG